MAVDPYEAAWDSLLNETFSREQAIQWLRDNVIIRGAEPAPEQVEAAAARIAASQGCDWNELCGYEKPAPDNEVCDSSSCVAAHFEDHDPAWARKIYRKMAEAAISAPIVQEVDADRG